MLPAPRTYSISVNTNIINKPDSSERVDFAKNWQAIEATPDEIADEILRGHAIAPQYVDGHRRGANFIKSGFLAADIDDGMTLPEAQDHTFVRQHASLIYTTPNHSSDRHRFRIVSFLDEQITKAKDYADALYGLALLLGSDKSASDGGRMFFGNSSAMLLAIGRTLPPAALADLIARGRDARAQGSARVKNRLPIDSSRQMGPGALVKLATGETCRMDELLPRASVHCPYHKDTNPSAFVVKSRRGSIGIYCAACKVTFWPDDDRDSYDFEAFDKLFEAKRIEEQQKPREDLIGFEQFFPPQPKIVRHQEQFLPPISYEPGITLVKSRKGSGKTEALVAMIRQIRADQFPDSIARRDRPRSILLIGHRRTLIREAAAKLGLYCYLEPDDQDRGGLLTLAVCLDSLPKYAESFSAKNGKPAWRRNGPFDLVILDEVEQVLKHLLSETIEKRAGLEQCYDALAYEITHAKAVIALDADLGLLTAHAMKRCDRKTGTRGAGSSTTRPWGPPKSAPCACSATASCWNSGLSLPFEPVSAASSRAIRRTLSSRSNA